MQHAVAGLGTLGGRSHAEQVRLVAGRDQGARVHADEAGVATELRARVLPRDEQYLAGRRLGHAGDYSGRFALPMQ